MKSKPSRAGTVAALLAAKTARSLQVKPVPPADNGNNTQLQKQSRRILAQHYRAKYGVK